MGSWSKETGYGSVAEHLVVKLGDVVKRLDKIADSLDRIAKALENQS